MGIENASLMLLVLLVLVEKGLTGESSGLDAVYDLSGIGTIVWFYLGGWGCRRRGKEEGEVGFLGCCVVSWYFFSG